MMNHRLTNVTAIMATFVVLLLSGARISSGEQLPDVNRTVIAEHVVKPESTYDNNMRLAFSVGSEVGHPETLQAILLVESRAGTGGLVGGKHLPVLKRSYGIMQIQVGTARSILTRTTELVERYFPNRQYRSITNNEIINLLLTNNEANIRIAAHNLLLNMKVMKGNWEKSVAAYNAGIGSILGKKTIPNPGYVELVRARLKKVVRPYNNDHDLIVE